MLLKFIVILAEHVIFCYYCKETLIFNLVVNFYQWRAGKDDLIMKDFIQLIYKILLTLLLTS